jgi:hypothetical protein
MALIKSEISKYKDIVLALDREMHNHGQKEISWDYFTHMDRSYNPHSVVIGKSSEELKQMGFMPTFTYDKEHLQNAMFPEGGLAPHAHGLSVDELLKLHHMLNNPVAIVTERDNKIFAGEEEYKPLQFILASRDDEGNQKYYRAMVDPQSHHNGMLAFGFVSKVITFHQIDEMKLYRIMDDVLTGNRRMLYFDNQKYLDLDSTLKPVELNNYESRALPIRGHFTQNPNLRKIAQGHQIALQTAATAEMNKLFIGRGVRGEAFPLLTSSMNALERGTSLDRVKSAYGTVYKITKLSTDRALRLRTQEMADKSFARSYLRLMTPELQQEYITKAANKIRTIPVNTKADLDGVCDLIEKFSDSIPTLQNMGINFSDTVANVPIIVNARIVSGQFKEAFETEMIGVLKDKNQEWHQNRNGLDDQEYAISIGNL